MLYPLSYERSGTEQCTEAVLWTIRQPWASVGDVKILHLRAEGSSRR